MVPPVPIDVIDLTDEVLDLESGECSTPDSSAPIRQGKRIGLWTCTVSYLTCDIISPEPRRIIIADDDDRDSTPRRSSSPPVVDPHIRSHVPPPPPVETRLLPQILKEKMEELVISTPVVARKRPLHSKSQAKRFKPNSRKGKNRIANFVNFHLPFGYEPLPKVDLGTLDDALKKLGVDI